ncbi:MAG TPA: hypothetical protein VKB03_05860 [Conexibacter sp.]|nr:hypothetical protein [Conexibacter sp.]
MSNGTASAAQLAANRICDAFVKAANADEKLPFPNGSCVIPSDVVTDDEIRESHERGKTVVIVDEHEHVTVLPAPDPSIAERESDRFWDELRAQR